MNTEIVSCPACGDTLFSIVKTTKKNRPNSLWTAKCVKCGTALGKGFWTVEQVTDNLMELVHGR